EHDRGFRVVQHVLGFLSGVLGVERHENRANLGHSKSGEEKLGTVRQQEGDPVTLFDSDPNKTIGDAIDRALELRVGPPALFENQRQLIRMLRYARAE
ncbi:MAG TPA: hypothetical protein VJQ55_13305, partial [Candidatus Binatia bacterium]|nr:hypothetical protein [Candidatus Binatia bacterium]